MTIRNYRLDFEVLAKFRSGEWAVQPTLGQIYIPAERRMLASQKTGDGYLYISIPPVRSYYPLARAIWIGSTMNVPEFEDLEVDHINEIKSDNRFENLRLLTPAGNSSRSKSRVTFETAEEIRHRYAAGNITQKILGKEYGCSKTTIGNIIKQNVYNHPRPQGKTKTPYENISRKAKEDIFSAFCVVGRKMETTLKRFKITRETLRCIIEEQSLRTNSAKHEQISAAENTAENRAAAEHTNIIHHEPGTIHEKDADSAKTAPKQMSETMTEQQTPDSSKTAPDKRVKP